MKKFFIFLLLIIFYSLIFSHSVYMKIEDKVLIKGLSENFKFNYPDFSDGFIVAIYGDSRWGAKIHKKIVGMISEFSPDVVVHLGDMVNKGNNLKEWELFFDITLPLRKNSYFQVVKGNHENPDEFFIQFFGVDNYYSDFLNYRFIYLDVDTGLENIKKFLIENVSKNTIVFIHYPIFTVGGYCKNPTIKSMNSLHDLFRSLGIKLVFSAHDHNYQRFMVDGINYVITGGGGASLYSKKCDNDFLVKFYKEYNFVILNITNSIIKLTTYDINKRIIDSLEIKF